MSWATVGEIAGKALPVLGTVLGGPAGGTVGAMIAGALGVEEDPQAVTKALQSPESYAQLKKWAYEHRERLEQIALDTLRAELADTASAREAHKHSPMPAAVTLLLTVICAWVIYLVFFHTIPEENKEIAYMLLGQAVTLWVASITYWVGTTRSSADKTRMLGK
jgi:hypothetical protein